MTESSKNAKKKYRAKGNRLTLDFYPSEADLFAQVAKQPKKQTYIKNLIREDMKVSKGKGIYLILKDDIDDASTIIGYIEGTEEDAEKYCDEHNSEVEYEWQEVTWVFLEKITKGQA